MPCLQGLLCKMGITVLSPCSLLLQVVGGSWDTPTKSHQKYPRGLVLHGLTGQEPATQVSISSTGRNRERANWDLLSYCSSLLFHFRSIDIIARDKRYNSFPQENVRLVSIHQCGLSAQYEVHIDQVISK